VTFSQDLKTTLPSIETITKGDSIIYLVQISIEAYSRTEKITARKFDTLVLANIYVISSLKEETFDSMNIIFDKDQIDTLVKFEKSIFLKSIDHNSGLKISGRMGQYTIFYNNKKYEFDSRNLYGLIDALNLKKENECRQ
jgi:hypothetical protein